MKSMTEELFEYGIYTENSDVRAHVSVVNHNIYVFQTKKGIKAIEKHEPRLRSAGQPGVKGVTGMGWPVSVDWIEDIRVRQYWTWPHWEEFSKDMNTSEKGALAVKCVLDCMKIGKFPFWVDATEDDRENIQIKGTDIVVFCRKKIQVKCDWKCGCKPKGTGNVFLQQAERNPLKNK